MTTTVQHGTTRSQEDRVNPQHAAMRLISREPDKELLAEALGLIGYLGNDSASATPSGHRAPKWREAGEDHRPREISGRPPGDAWRHQRIQRVLGGEKIA